MNSCSFTARWNEALLDENYQKWQRSPRSVSSDWAAFFEGFELGTTQAAKNGAPAPPSGNDEQRVLQTKVDGMIHMYRMLGHSIAKLDPFSEPPPQQAQAGFALESFGFKASDLEKEVSSHLFRADKKFKLRELILILERIYCASIGAEFMHIQDACRRDWVSVRLESEQEKEKTTVASYHCSGILRTLYKAEAFEHFLHANYVGHKRFSLEGAESLLVSLQALMDGCEECDIRQVVLGMTHRGRLNVLANLLHKPLEAIFDEFNHNALPQTAGSGGDVKYHLGFHTTRKDQTGHEVQVYLAANPSHLEAVSPIVQGKTRALQHILGDNQDRKRVLAILIHGDAAFAAQGVVAETFNLSQLSGYQTEGTVHIIINNQIGFTTLPSDARSSRYCTDVAKMVEAPIFHVNGDDPLAVHAITRIALEFRQNFGKDVVIDIICFRRHGHNEADEPTFTQPSLYKKIKGHPLLSDIFLKKTEELGIIEGKQAVIWKGKEIERLEAALAQSRLKADDHATSEKSGIDEPAAAAAIQPSYSHRPVQTAIGSAMLDEIMQALTTVPKDFRVLPKVRRTLLERRRQIWQAKGPYDWGIAEALAFGSLLLEKIPVRLSGQDSQRGTFSHRHSILHDEITCERYIPLNHLSPYQAKFCVYNSPLSEYAVLGFDYGYSMECPSTLCLWEAQFGDFANGAQIIIDQFISSSETKWHRQSSIIMLLPHGYEGQGPEHSSSRLERYLQLCAEENMQVCNLSTPAQYFHVLRRQIHGKYRKPLIIMTPKSLLRHEQSVSKAQDFTNSHFFEILSNPPDYERPEKVQRIVFCSGKVYYDLLQYRAIHQLGESVVLIRVEQLYPLNEEEVVRVFQRYPSTVQVVWCQEEPSNMGAWAFICPQLRRLLGCEISYAGRPASASPATGFSFTHKKQQVELVKAAFGF
jgi:2-oxoglutarate dehydrogenase E1 component